MNNDWLPPDLPAFNLNQLPKFRSGNKLLDDDDPVIHRIGEFLYSEPDDMPTGLRAMGGLLLGLNIARVRPDVAEHILDWVTERDPDDGTPFENAAHQIIYGEDDEDPLD